MIDRIHKILRQKKYTASRFADKIGVQRSSVSHIMSGRNKPSLDFIQKVLIAFPDIEAGWLVSGRGNMTPAPQTGYENNPPDNKEKPVQSVTSGSDGIIDEGLFADNLKTTKRSVSPDNQTVAVEKIVVFFKDGSFREYSPR